jgi:hypothetical protein
LLQPRPSEHLARQLRATDYFTLGWEPWSASAASSYGRLAAPGGALGALLGFVIGGALLPHRMGLRQPGRRLPDAAGEIAYTSAVFTPRQLRYRLDDMLAYFIVCPWEVVAVGHRGYIIPGLDSIELYRIAGRPV